jgi:uncharacterized protein
MIQNLSIPSVHAAFYVALLALGAFLLGLLVVRERAKTKTILGDGGRAALARLIPVHANYSENVPFGLALLIMLCVSGATAWPVHGVGLCLVLGRLAHAVGVSQSSGPNAGGAAGRLLTRISPISGAVFLLRRLI